MVLNPQDLAQLRDIHMPKPIGWWPLPLGWFIVAGILIVISVIGARTLYRYYINNRAKRIALLTLSRYQRDNKLDNDLLIAAKISELLKQVALAYYPRKQVASLQGDAWLAFLNRTAKGVNFDPVRHELLESPYRSTPAGDLSLLFKTAFNWIKRQGRLCSN